MPNKAINQYFSGLIYTDKEAIPIAKIATIFIRRKVYTSTCFKELAVYVPASLSSGCSYYKYSNLLKSMI